jgi:hypothetical protein
MRHLAVVALAAVIGLTLVSAAASFSYPPGGVYVGFKGWGTVRFGKGFTTKGQVTCTKSTCPSTSDPSGYRASLTATAATGWKFTGWRGACKSQRRTCKVNLHHVLKDVSGFRWAHTVAVFKAVTPGFTRGDPVPLGHAAYVGGGFRLTVNSVTPNVQLSQPAPAGAEYFAANVTATYVGPGASYLSNDLVAVGSHNYTYDTGCIYGEPAPILPDQQLYSGQSESGNICWTVATNDGSSLVMNTGTDYMIWFALR